MNIVMNSAVSWFALGNESSSSFHYSDVIMDTMASQITGFTIGFLTVYSSAYQRSNPSSASPAFLRGIHRWPGNSPHKGRVTRKMFPFGDVVNRSLIYAYEIGSGSLLCLQMAVPKSSDISWAPRDLVTNEIRHGEISWHLKCPQWLNN